MIETWLNEQILFTFRPRPVPLPGDLRPDWRVALLLLILDICCRGGKSNLQRLLVINWAIGDQGSREAFISYLNGQLTPDSLIVRYEPWLIRAVEFAEAEGLIKREGTTVVLEIPGIEMVKEVRADDKLFKEEKRFLDTIRSRASEKSIRDLLRGGFETWR